MSLTQSPDSTFIEFVVEKAMVKYPLVIADNQDPLPIKVRWKVAYNTMTYIFVKHFHISFRGFLLRK